MVVRVPQAQDNSVAVQAAPRVMQRAPGVGFGQEVGRAVSQLGQTMGAVAQQWDERLAKIDEAEVMELDSQFGDWERNRLRGEGGFLRLEGRAALNARDQVVSDFDDRQRAALEAAQGPRQREMLERVFRQRRDRFLDQVETHAAVQTEKYWDDSFNARLASVSNDVAAAPNDPDRLPQMIAVRDMIAENGQRKGWDQDMILTAQREAFTNIHRASIANLLETATPRDAQAYLDQWSPQIEATALVQLRGVVREQVDLFDADEAANGPAGGPRPPAVVPANPDGGEARPFTLRPPVSATVSSDFGPRRRPIAGASANHGGVDYAVPAFTPVAAAGPGRITFAGEQGGYGNVVVIDHGGGYETRYAHLGRINVRVGDTVEAGRTVALSGGARGMDGAGTSTGAHLHFEVRHNGEAVDPEAQVGRELAGGPAAPRRAGQTTPQPQTLEDALEAADAAAGPDADWRRRQAFRQAFTSRYSLDQSAEADKERKAADAVAPYLPHGAQAAASYDQIPLSIRQALSPQQDTQIRGIFAREAEGDGETDNDVLNALLDIRVYQPDRFASMDLTPYADQLATSQFNAMLQDQREARVRQAGDQRELADAALRGTDDMTMRLLRSANMNGDERARAQLRSYVMTAVESYVRRTGETPDEETVTGYFMQGLREFQVTDDRGRRERVRAFQVEPGQEAFQVIPPRDRNDVVRRLRQPPYNLQNPTSQQVQDFYRRGVQEGLYTPARLRRPRRN